MKDKPYYSQWDNTPELRAEKDKLKESGLWSDKELSYIWFNTEPTGVWGTERTGLSTGMVARLLGVARNNVQAYCNKEKNPMKCWRTVPSFDRLIPAEEVIDWKLNHSHNKGK